MTHADWRGAGTALVTPFLDDGTLDLDTFRSLVVRQVEAGVRFLIVAGTTGESATLSAEEKRALVEVAREQADGRALVVAGTGGSDTREAVASARRAAEAGADAVLSLVPPYNKPPQDALVAHFRWVADEAGVPVILYNVPGRTGCNLGAEATLELAEHERIVALKDAGGLLEQSMEILRRRPAGFEVLSGEDTWTLALMAHGGGGVISVIGNEAPGATAQLVDHALAGRLEQARTLHELLFPLMRANFLECNPIPVKAALKIIGLCGPALRAPLRPLAAQHRERLTRALQHAGLLSTAAGMAS